MSEQYPDSLQPGYFDNVYAANEDPWGFATSEYEQRKYADTVGHLPRPRYDNAFEVGCSIGVLTALLGPRCKNLLSIDVSETALSIASKRCATLSNVRLQRMQFPEQQPDSMFDLVVVSEVAYYWRLADLETAMDQIAAHHLADGHLILVHWTPFVADYPLRGDEVHDLWLRRSEWELISDERRPQYRISLLRRIT